MPLGSGWRAAAIGLGVLLFASSRAYAADEEIQVYIDDMSKQGQFGLDTHVNYVWDNKATPDYPGQQPSLDRTRITPEWAYGLTPNIELGAYLPLTTIDSHGKYEVDGYKFRIKYIAPKAKDQSYFWGVNFEIGDVAHRLDINPWNAELKGIVGWRGGPWLVAFNTNIDFAVAGPDKGSPSVQFATKVNYSLNDKVSVGIESYDGAGTFRDFGNFSGAGHSIYLVSDAEIGKWDLNIGVGRGYSGEPDAWTFKMIVGVPIDD